MKKKKMFVSAVILVLLFAIPAAFAGPFGGGLEGWEGRVLKKLEWVSWALDLTLEQQAEVRQYHEEHKGRMKEVFEGMRASGRALKKELEKSKVDMAAIDAIAAEIKSQLTKIVDYKVEGVVEIKKILTPDQFAKLLRMKKEKKNF